MCNVQLVLFYVQFHGSHHVSSLRHVRNNNREIMSLETTRKLTQTGFMHVDFALSKVCFTEYMHLDTELDYEL